MLTWGDESDEYKKAKLYEYTKSARAPGPEPTQKRSEKGKFLRCTAELDSFAAGTKLKSAGFNPVVLNMANEYNCGGKWCDKQGYQEEVLFRASTLPLSLWPHRRADDNRLAEYDQHLPRAEAFYPWTECGVIYSPAVRVLRDASGPLDVKEQVSPIF